MEGNEIGDVLGRADTAAAVGEEWRVRRMRAKSDRSWRKYASCGSIVEDADAGIDGPSAGAQT